MEKLNLTTLLTGISVVLALIVFAKSHYKSKEDAKRELEYEKRFTAIETWQTLFTGALKRDLGKMLHSPHRSELDKIIDKIDNQENLSKEEALKAVEILDETLHDPHLRPGEEVGIKLYKAAIIADCKLWEVVT